MFQGVHRIQLEHKSQSWLQGPLTHFRAAALAAALLPLASMAAAPASAQVSQGYCVMLNGEAGATICGFVWNDANNNGIQDAGETGIAGADVTLFDGTTSVGTFETQADGFYDFAAPAGDSTYTVSVSMSNTSIPAGTLVSPTGAGGDTTLDSDGSLDQGGVNSVVTNVVVMSINDLHVVDFGFYTPSVQQPGTGTPGYWKNHPDDWPVEEITVGGVLYSKDEAIMWLKKVGKDKTTTLFSSLVSAMLNVMIGNWDICVADEIGLADAWMADHHVGTNVLASSPAWALAEPWHKKLDAYNNGLLCAPHRN